ncbi:MAG: hypothetical protein AAFX99_12715, partial [Myxococcota bacterium]
QTGSLVSNEAQREMWFGTARTLMARAAAAYPDNRVIGMYLDTPIPWEPLPTDPNAPEWAQLQREALTKLSAIIDFWIEERQAPDGQFGGGWGDDVEMWRWWTPILVGFHHRPAQDAQARLSEGIFALERLADGYSNILTDVEHSAEDTADAITPMLLARTGDSVWDVRALRLADLMENLWTDRNARDQRQFTTTAFTATIVSTNANDACDTVYHTRAVQPILHLWLRTRDPELTTLMTDWLRTWVEASNRDARGKPAGILPSAIHWPSGDPGGPRDAWWMPGCALNANAFDWPSAMSPMLRALVQAWFITQDPVFLEPLETMAQHRRDYLDNPQPDPEPGTTAWAASQSTGFLTQALARYRLASGDTRYDDLLLDRADGYVHYRLTGDEAPLLAALEQTQAAVAINRQAYTSEVRWTDRVMRFARSYANLYAPEPLERPDTQLLYEMVTGDFEDPLYFPQPAVQWTTSPKDIALFVREATTTQLQASIYLFEDVPRILTATTLQLQPGTYGWSLTCADGSNTTGTLQAEPSLFPSAMLTIPPRTLCTWAVEPQ